MNLTSLNIPLLAAALISLTIGLLIYWRIKPTSQKFLTTLLICWLLIALFPVFLIYSFFPSASEISGKLLGFSMSGVFAAFIFIWMYGAKKTVDAVTKDALNNKIAQLEHQLDAAKIINTPTPQKLLDGQTYPYSLTKVKNKKISLITGSLQAVHDIDIWVNSENTNMQMASYFDRSISGTIRYYGAKKDDAGNVTQDIIYQELTKQLKGNIVVVPATVIPTDAGELAITHGVKKIFHVATVQGSPGFGYRPVADIGACVTKALEKADSQEFAGLQPRSILFPLLGTGQGSGDLKTTIKVLIESAIVYLETHPESTIEVVCFLTLFDNHLAICKDILDSSTSIHH
jgi:O-acetyl-ADP-ribose deacetylase (regulator of RNase III)